MKSIFFLILASIPFACPAEAALSCPTSIALPHIFAAPPAGWQATSTIAGTAPLIGVAVFDGPPANGADLIPDIEKTTEKHFQQVWTLAEMHGHGRTVWIECRYRNTEAALTHEVPDAAKLCTLDAGYTGAQVTGPVSVSCR